MINTQMRVYMWTRMNINLFINIYAHFYININVWV